MSKKLTAQRDLGAQYREAARDATREREAQTWSEGLAGGVDETR